jgi:hypothetical protein
MALSNEVTIENRERRRHGRIDDEIVMFWRELNPDEIPEEYDEKDEMPVADYPLSTQLKLLSLETGELLKRIGRTNPLLAEYLTVLEQKIDALASEVIVKDNFTHCHSTRHVNLSASGLAFLSEKEYALGTLLEVKMVFSPTLTSIVAYGRVIYCIHYDDDKPLSHRIGVGFIRLHDCDREMLIGRVSSRLALDQKTWETH